MNLFRSQDYEFERLKSKALIRNEMNKYDHAVNIAGICSARNNGYFQTVFMAFCIQANRTIEQIKKKIKVEEEIL